jgi:hypothetical protein
MTALKTTALRPLFLAVLVAAIIGGVTIVWWLLPLGLLVYAASVLLAARDPKQLPLPNAAPWLWSARWHEHN